MSVRSLVNWTQFMLKEMDIPLSISQMGNITEEEYMKFTLRKKEDLNMVIQMDEKKRQKMMRDGSVLKFLRAAGGGGRGMMGAGIAVLICGVFIALLFAMMGMPHASIPTVKFMAVPSAVMIVGGFLLWQKRISGYFSYYKKITGFSDEELQKLDRELASPDTIIIGCRGKDGNKKHEQMVCHITEHYFVARGEYIRRIEDMIAMAFTAETAIWVVLCLAKQDDDLYFFNVPAPTEDKKVVSMEIIQAMCERNPTIIPVQRFEYNGKRYNLMEDSQEIRQMYLDGRRFIAE